MPAPKKGPRFGKSAAHQKLIMANMAASLFEAGAITTTLARAKYLRPYAEKLITKAKKMASTGITPMVRFCESRSAER